jgi:hypothetical protein
MLAGGEDHRGRRAARAAADVVGVLVDEVAEHARGGVVVVGDVVGERAGDDRIGGREHVVQANFVATRPARCSRTRRRPYPHPPHRDHRVAVVGQRDRDRTLDEVGADAALQAVLRGRKLLGNLVGLSPLAQRIGKYGRACRRAVATVAWLGHAARVDG